MSTDKDDGAERALTHHAIPDVDDTEPRLICDADDAGTWPCAWSHHNHQTVAEAVECARPRRPVPEPRFDLIEHLDRQRDFSLRTFGPGHRSQGVVDHIRKELIEIEAEPLDLSEWVDVILLALDGAWRAGHSPLAIAQGIAAKQAKNEQRAWPDNGRALFSEDLY